MVAVSGDTKQSVLDFFGGNTDLPFLVDSDSAIAGSYQLEATPTEVFIDGQGRIGQIVEGGVTATQIQQTIGRLQFAR